MGFLLSSRDEPDPLPTWLNTAFNTALSVQGKDFHFCGFFKALLVCLVTFKAHCDTEPILINKLITLI